MLWALKMGFRLVVMALVLLGIFTLWEGELPKPTLWADAMHKISDAWHQVSPDKAARQNPDARQNRAQKPKQASSSASGEPQENLSAQDHADLDALVDEVLQGP